MLELKNVTLVTIDTVNDWESKSNPRLAAISKIFPALCDRIQFGDTLCVNPFGKNKHLLDEKFPTLWEYDFDILPRNLGWYNNFVVKKLPFLIKTEWYIVIQWDGFPLNRWAWNNEFFNYPFLGGGHSVYNGGFSLRNTDFMRFASNATDDLGFGNEDGFYSSFLNNEWNIDKKTPIKINWDPEVPSKFAQFIVDGKLNSFGWHRSNNLSQSTIYNAYKLIEVFTEKEINLLTDLCVIKELKNSIKCFDIKDYQIDYNENFFNDY